MNAPSSGRIQQVPSPPPPPPSSSSSTHVLGSDYDDEQMEPLFEEMMKSRAAMASLLSRRCNHLQGLRLEWSRDSLRAVEMSRVFIANRADHGVLVDFFGLISERLRVVSGQGPRSGGPGQPTYSHSQQAEYAAACLSLVVAALDASTDVPLVQASLLATHALYQRYMHLFESAPGHHTHHDADASGTSSSDPPQEQSEDGRVWSAALHDASTIAARFSRRNDEIGDLARAVEKYHPPATSVKSVM